MNNSEEADKKMLKAKSFSTSPLVKGRSEPSKRKSFNVNEAVKSLDLALVRLKKSKLVNGECITATGSPPSPGRRACPEMFMDVSSNSGFRPGVDNASLLSLNFSHYELVRNLSSSICNSEGAFSTTTCNDDMDSPDTNEKNEHLERYFRSVEMWSQRNRGVGPSLRFNMPNK